MIQILWKEQQEETGGRQGKKEGKKLKSLEIGTLKCSLSLLVEIIGSLNCLRFVFLHFPKFI